MDRIQFDRDDIKCYLEETDERGRKVNTNYSERENDFIKNIKGITTLKNSLDGETGFFEILRKLDKMMLGEEADGRTVADKYGYLSEAEVEEILKWIFVERYVVAHAEDNTDEKPMNIALQDFISDKYDSGVHFFEEILQNIDDAIGRTKDLKDENNNVEISWKDKKIIFTYPDRGFSFYDLMAITSLGNSIKKGDLEHASIGEKGIGFKSVFSVAKQVDITSKYFSFGIKYDRERKASVLQPDYIELNGDRSNGTVLKITFFDEFAIEDEVEKVGFRTQLRNWLFENKKENYLNYSPFLFLKNVKKISYSEDNKRTDIVIERNTIEGTELFSTKINSAQFLLYRSSLQFNKELIANRWGDEYIKDKDENYFIDRPIEIAFPIVMDGAENDAKEKKGLFYSFLPTEMVIDNPIYINVDVHLKSSRGRISESDFKDGSEWNKYVLNNLQNALETAYMAVINNKDNETVWKVAKKLYLYMQTTQNTTHYFGGILKQFVESIKKGQIYLNCKKEFVAEKDIWSPNITDNEKWNDFVAFCLMNPFPGDGIGKKQYAYDYDWFCFSKPQDQQDDKWMAELINVYKGIEEFYNNSEYISADRNKIVLWLLKGAMETSTLPKSEWKILFVEDKERECGYRISSKNEIESSENEIESSKNEIEKSKKVIFFHNTSEDIDDELSIYINENVFDSDEQKRLYKDCLEGFVPKKDWGAFVGNKLKNLVKEEDISIEICFDKTYKYVSKIEDINKINVPKEIKELASKVVLPVDGWKHISKVDEGEKVYLMRIAEYLTNQSCEGYRLFERDTREWENEEVNRYYNYLVHLGCKAKPEIIQNSYDALTQAIMPDYANTTTDSETLLFVFDGDEDEKKLKKYLVDFSRDSRDNNNFDVSVFKNFPFEKVIFINPDILQKGFIIPIQTTGPLGGTTGYSEYHPRTEPFTEVANKDYLLFNGKKEKLSINSGQVIFASNKYVQFTSSKNTLKFPENKSYIFYDDYINYININDDDKKKRIYYNSDQKEIIEKIINSFPKDMLNKIRWISIWNKVFSVNYKWLEDVNMEIEDFLSCYEYIGRTDIDSLFKDKYNVNWPNNIYYNGCVTDEVKEYLCGEFETDRSRIEDISAEKYCAIEVSQDFEKDFLVLKEYKKLNREEKDYSHLIFISEDSKTKKTDYVIKILKTIDILLNDVQQKELCDILDEIGEGKNKKIVGLQDVCSDFSECIFNDDSNSLIYSNILEEAKKQLPSVWKKNKNTVQNNSDWSMKNWLCEPYKTEGFVFQGYGYQCPICGSLSKIHSLSGLKFLRRLKNSDINSKEQMPYLHLITCLNCADMIEGATKIAIKDYDGKNLVESIKHFEEVCYCADQYHMYNNSKMKTMKLIMEIDEQEFCEDIKVSFLHLTLFAKLLKNT